MAKPVGSRRSEPREPRGVDAGDLDERRHGHEVARRRLALGAARVRVRQNAPAARGERLERRPLGFERDDEARVAEARGAGQVRAAIVLRRAHVDDDPLVAVRREELLRVRRRELWDCRGIHGRVEAVGRREHLGYDGARAPRLLVGARDRGSVGSFDGAGYDAPVPMLLRICFGAASTPMLMPSLMLALPSSTATVDAKLLVGTHWSCAPRRERRRARTPGR